MSFKNAPLYFTAGEVEKGARWPHSRVLCLVGAGGACRVTRLLAVVSRMSSSLGLTDLKETVAGEMNRDDM